MDGMYDTCDNATAVAHVVHVAHFPQNGGARVGAGLRPALVRMPCMRDKHLGQVSVPAVIGHSRRRLWKAALRTVGRTSCQLVLRPIRVRQRSSAVALAPRMINRTSLRALKGMKQSPDLFLGIASALRALAMTLCRRIGWQPVPGGARPFQHRGARQTCNSPAAATGTR